MNIDGGELLLVGGGREGVLLGLARLDRLTGVLRFRLEQRFNGCSFCFFDRSSGLMSSGLEVGVKRQWAAGGGGGEGLICSSSDIAVIGILFESPGERRERE